MFRPILASITLVVLSSASFSSADLVQNISTGINRTTGAQLPNNASDPNWVVATGGDGTGYAGQNLIARSTPLPSVYMPDSASTGSRWVAINSGQGLEGISLPGANYSFQTTVDLTGFNPATASIPTGQFAVDDAINDIRINGKVITLPSGFAMGLDRFYTLPTNLGAGLFTSGINTITFDLINAVPGTPVAFRMEASVSASVPEPTGLLLMAGFAAMLSRRSRS